tara:strand:+ start:161825 stop:163090 length:1266 start_codon:yes stop_codon:yes gene_type:complete
MGHITSQASPAIRISEPTHRLYDSSFVIALTSQTCFVIANTLMAHYSRWVEFLGGSLQQIGWVMGIGSMMGLLLRPTMAQWINRIGARSMWALGYMVFAISAFANLVLVDVGILIYLLRSLLFLGAAIVFSSSLTYISQTAPADRRTEAIGILGVGGFLGMLVGPLLGDLLLGPGARDRAGFSMLFVSAAIANLVAFSLLLFLPRPVRNGPKRSVALRDFVATSIQHWPGMILLIDFAFGVCMTVPFIFLAAFIDGSPLRIEGVSVIGLFFWCYAGVAIAVRLGFRRLPDRVGPKRVLIVGAMFMSFGMFSYLLVNNEQPWAIVIPALLTGAGHGLMFHTMTSLTVARFPHEVQGTGSVWALMMLDLGTIAGAPALGVIGQHFGFQTMFVAVGVSCLLAIACYSLTTLGPAKPIRPASGDA